MVGNSEYRVTAPAVPQKTLGTEAYPLLANLEPQLQQHDFALDQVRCPVRDK